MRQARGVDSKMLKPQAEAYVGSLEGEVEGSVAIKTSKPKI